MAVPTDPAEAFLEGAALAVALPEVGTFLNALWHRVAEGEGGSSATRVSLGTLVVVTSAERSADCAATWREVAAAFPSRAVLVVVDPSAGAGYEAAVSAACRWVGPGEPQVCSERILLTTGPTGLDGLPGAVLPLLDADVPASLWWDLPEPPPGEMIRHLARFFERCLTDLTLALDPAATHAVLAGCGRAVLADLAWYRAASWREGVARLFDPDPTAAIRDVAHVGVETAAGSSQLLPAALLGGWVAGQLGWRRRKVTGLRSSWTRPNGMEGVVELTAVPVGDGRPGRLQAVTLSAWDGSGQWRLERLRERPRELLVAARHRDWCALPSRVPAPRPEPARVLLRAVTDPLANRPRDRALAHAAWLLSWENGTEPFSENGTEALDPSASVRPGS